MVSGMNKIKITKRILKTKLKISKVKIATMIRKQINIKWVKL